MTAKKTSKESTKKVAKRKVARRRIPRSRREVRIAAVSDPKEVMQNVPKGFRLLGVQPLGVFGRKIWLEVTIVPET